MWCILVYRTILCWYAQLSDVQRVNSTASDFLLEAEQSIHFGQPFSIGFWSCRLECELKRFHNWKQMKRKKSRVNSESPAFNSDSLFFNSDNKLTCICCVLSYKVPNQWSNRQNCSQSTNDRYNFPFLSHYKCVDPWIFIFNAI